MRVLHVLDNISLSSGISSIVMNFYRNISDIQFDFLVSVHSERNHEEEIKSLGGKVFYMTDSFSLSAKLLPDMIKNSKKFFKENAKNYDIVHLHTLTFCYPYLYYAKKYGAKHRVSHAHSISFGNSKLSSIRNSLMLMPLKSLSTAFLSCSREAGEKFYYPLGIKEFETMLNGISFEKFAFDVSARAEVRREFGVDDGTILVGHISNMTPLKKVPFAVKCFAEFRKSHPNSKLLLIGKDKLPESVSSAIEGFGVSDSVINAGVRYDVPRCLSALDICLMPSLTEGLGLVTVECQASGVPVVTSKGFPKEVYASEICVGLEYDEKLWVKAMSELYEKRLQPVDLKAAEMSFDIKNVTQKLHRFYASQLR